MRKTLCFLCLFLTFFTLSAQETEQDKALRRFSFNWSMSYAGHPEAFSRSSILGIGMVIYHNDRIDIRNQIEFYNGVMVMESLGTSYYKKVLSEKISIGKMTRGNLFRPYGFIEGRVGTCGEELYDYWKNPLVGNIGLGTGVNVFTGDALSYFIEFGFLGNFYQAEFLPQQRFELGVMYHF